MVLKPSCTEEETIEVQLTRVPLSAWTLPKPLHARVPTLRCLCGRVGAWALPSVTQAQTGRETKIQTESYKQIHHCRVLLKLTAVSGCIPQLTPLQGSSPPAHWPCPAFQPQPVHTNLHGESFNCIFKSQLQHLLSLAPAALCSYRCIVDSLW